MNVANIQVLHQKRFWNGTWRKIVSVAKISGNAAIHDVKRTITSMHTILSKLWKPLGKAENQIRCIQQFEVTETWIHTNVVHFIRTGIYLDNNHRCILKSFFGYVKVNRQFGVIYIIQWLTQSYVMYYTIFWSYRTLKTLYRSSFGSRIHVAASNTNNKYFYFLEAHQEIFFSINLKHKILDNFKSLFETKNSLHQQVIIKCAIRLLAWQIVLVTNV